jgi:Glycosyltransferase Family 4
MSSLQVLITTAKVVRRSGSELYVWDLAMGLLERGHTPIVYSTKLGPLAGALREHTVPVVDNLGKVAAAPDIIHGQSNHGLITALLRFPNTPAIRICHGWNETSPPQLFPRILRFVAVDYTVRDRLLFEWGIPEEQVRVHLNFADLQRFQPRGPLPRRPARALVFSNNAREHLWAVQQACAHMGIGVDALGASVGNSSSCPETLLRDYDIVFAKGRCAIEALVTGTAVVLCDAAGVGPMVTSDGLDRLRLLNFGLRTLRERVAPEVIAREVARYDADDAAQVSQQLRTDAGRDAAVESMIELYEEVIEAYRRDGGNDLRLDLQAAAAYLETLASHRSVPLGYEHPSRALLRTIYRTSRRLPGLRMLVRFPAVEHLVQATRWKFRF